MSIAPLLTQIYDTFEKLGRVLRSSPESTLVIDDVVKAIDNIKNKHDKEEVAKSSAFSAIRSFLDKFKAVENTIDSTLESGRKTLNLVKKIAKYYNEVADLCGCPRVPSVFLND